MHGRSPAILHLQMSRRTCLLAASLEAASAHGDPKDWPINPVLGVSGFPDCHRLHPERDLSMEELKELGFKLGSRKRVVKWGATGASS